MLEYKDTTFRYGRHKTVLEGANLTYGPGIHLLLGPNGSGKTTMLRLGAGLIKPTAGKVLVDGTDPFRRLPATMATDFMLADDFESPYPTFGLLAQLHGAMYPNFNAEKFAALLEQAGLGVNRKINRMSLGMRRKAFDIYAICLGTDLLMMDEPSNGLDIEARKILKRTLVSEVREDQCVVISTHQVGDFEQLADTVTFLSATGLAYKADTSRLAERLAFSTSPIPDPSALYSEQNGPYYSNILAKTGDMESTAPDIALVYSALVSDASETIKKVISDE